MDNKYSIPFYNPLYNSVTDYWNNKEKKIFHSKSQSNIYNNSSYKNNYKENEINNKDNDYYIYENEQLETPRTKNFKLHQEMFNFDFNNKNNDCEKYNNYYDNNQNNFMQKITKYFTNSLNLQNKKAINDINKMKKDYNEMKNDLENRFEKYEKNQNNIYKILKRHIEDKLRKNDVNELNYKIRKLNNKKRIEDMVENYLENIENKMKINKIVELEKRFIQNPTERIYPIRNFNSNFYNENNFNPNFSYLPNINRQNSFFLNRNKKNRSATINTEQLNNLILEKIEINQKRIKDIQKQNNIFRNYFNNISKKLSNNNFNSIRNLNNNNTIFDKEPITEKRLKKIKSDLNINKNYHSYRKSKSKNKKNKKKKKK